MVIFNGIVSNSFCEGRRFFWRRPLTRFSVNWARRLRWSGSERSIVFIDGSRAYEKLFEIRADPPEELRNLNADGFGLPGFGRPAALLRGRCRSAPDGLRRGVFPACRRTGGRRMLARRVGIGLRRRGRAGLVGMGGGPLGGEVCGGGAAGVNAGRKRSRREEASGTDRSGENHRAKSRATVPSHGRRVMERVARINHKIGKALISERLSRETPWSRLLCAA